MTALLAQTYPAELLELIVVDDASSPTITDAELVPEQPRAGASSGHAQGGPRLLLVSSGGNGPAAARNAGAAIASGCDLLLFTDDDAVPAPTWVAEMAAGHLEETGAALGGPISAIAPRNPFSAAYCAIDRAARTAHLRCGRPLIAGANLAVPAARFAEIGGFDPDYLVSEDRDLCGRWLARGWPMRFRETAVVAHAHPKTLSEFWSTFVRYGRGAHRFHRAARGGAHGDAGIRVSVATLAAAVSSSRSPRRLALVAVWQAATIAGFAQAALRSAIRRIRRSVGGNGGGSARGAGRG